MKDSAYSALKLAGGLAISLGCSIPATASVILIDDFSTTQGVVVQVGQAAPQQSVLGNRTIRITSTTPDPLADPFNRVTAVSNSQGSFAISNPFLTTSTIELTYNLAANAMFTSAGPGSGVLFDVISRDLASNVAINFSGVSGNFAIAATAIPVAPPIANFFVALTPAQVSLMAGGGSFTMTFSGTSDYDLGIDNLRVSVPAPAAAGLLGLGLLGLALAQRRRQ